MPEPLKNMYNETFFKGFINVMSTVYPALNPHAFKKDIMDKHWEQLELKQRMQHIAEVMHTYLPTDYITATTIIIRLVKTLQRDEEHMSFEYMFLPEYVENYGLEHYEASVIAMEAITKFTSCEFAVRPFLLRYPEQMNAQMLKWAKHDNAMVRRLASEGMRPRLPWGMGLAHLKKDPSAVLPILELLKNDPSESVRRSVANNLNDISKDHPELVLQIVTRWLTESPGKNMQWLVKHACRTLLKQGHRGALSFFGFDLPEAVTVNNLKVLTPQVAMGDHLEFQFDIVNRAATNVLLRIEYGIYYKKANGSLSRKVFKISEKQLLGTSSIKVNRKQSFKPITTRKHYAGAHEVSVILNGVELQKAQFELLNHSLRV